MARGTSRQTVDKGRWLDFARVGRSFAEAADLAREFEYWNAAGVLLVHAAIALTNALTVRLAGTKSAGEDHAQAAALLQATVLGDEDSKRALRQLRSLLLEKSRVSYSGEIYNRRDVERMRKHFERFTGWAEKLLME